MPIEKKSKSWELFWSYHLNNTADLANLAQFWGEWAGLTGSSKTAPRIFIFLIILGAEYLSYLIVIATYADALTFFGYIISVLDNVYLMVNVLTLSEYSSFSVRPKARAMTRFFPKKNVECVFQLSRTCWKWVFRILSTANTNNLGYSSTDFLILSTKAWKLNKYAVKCKL